VSGVPGSYWETLPLGREVELVQRDPNGLIALAKPAGLLSHPNAGGDEPRSLLTVRYHPDGEFYAWNASGVEHRFFLLNRLDSATSGLLLGATNEALAREVRALFQKKHIRKVYNALVFGVPTASQQVWKDRLAVEKKAGQIRTQASAGNIPAESAMRVLRARQGVAQPLALVALEPRTGRSHQLRVQCAKRHLPIVGDATYGDFGANRTFAKATGEKRLFLHSLETRFEYTLGGRSFSFSAKAELPKAFTNVWGKA
jgi:tRNA pseudouridine65 synthase